MIKFVSGDILQTGTQYLAQGVAVGSQEGLGTGLALQISTKWPDAQKKFKKFTFNNKFEGGDIFIVKPAEDRPGIIYIATARHVSRCSAFFEQRFETPDRLLFKE